MGSENAKGNPAYLLSPISSMAVHGGPMKTSPASVHFRAKSEFSLNYDGQNNQYLANVTTQAITLTNP